MKKVNSFCASACETSSWPVWREKVWKSLTAPGSVATTFSTWPGLMAVSAFFVRRIGSGQFSPRASSSLSKFMKLLCRMDESSPLDVTQGAAADPAAAEGWLLTIAQLPTDDPASRMRVLRTLESLGSAVMRDGVYLLPDTGANRQSLEALTDYIVRIGGSAHVLLVAAVSEPQHHAFRLLFDRSARYEALIKTVESLRVGFGHSDPSAISRVVHKQRREFEAIAALDFFPTAARKRA